MPRLHNSVDPRGIKLELLKDNSEPGLMSLVFNFCLSEREGTVFRLFFFHPPPPQIFLTDANNRLFLPEWLTPLKWSFFLFIFSASGQI